MRDYYQDCTFLGIKPIDLLHRYGVNGKVSGSLAAIAEIQNAQPILHAPVGCGFHYRTSARTRFSPSYKLAVTNLTSDDIVFGGEEKLRTAIQALDAAKRPDLIAVISSCVSAVINEDIGGMISQIQSHTKAKIMYIQSEAFSHPNKNSSIKRLQERVASSGNKTAASKVQYQGCGFIEALNALVEQVMQPQKVLPGTVNIESFAWGFGGAGRLALVRSKLETIGLQVNCFLPTATFNKIEAAPQAELNIVRRLRWAQRMQQRFQTPYLHFPNLDDWQGAEGIRDFYMLIARQFGLEKMAEKVLQEEWQKISYRLQAVRSYLGQFRYVLVTHAISSVPDLIRLYERDYSMPLAGICLFLPDSYSHDAGIDQDTLQKMYTNIDAALVETGSKAVLAVNPEEQELRSIFEQADCIVGTNQLQFEGLGAAVLPQIHEYRPLDYEQYTVVLENFAAKVKNRKEKRHLLLSRLAYSRHYYPLLAENDSLASREMWITMWRTR